MSEALIGSSKPYNRSWRELRNSICLDIALCLILIMVM